MDGRATRWAGHRARRRQDFVSAALLVIERDGPAAGVDRISAELGVGRQALYRQFEDRADLDRAVADRAADLLVEAIVPHLFCGAELDEVVRRAVDAYVGHVEGHLHLYRFIRAYDSDVVTRVKDTVGGRIAVLARELLDELGPEASSAAETLALGAVGLVDAVVGRWLDEPAGVARADLVGRLVVMVRGAGAALLASGGGDAAATAHT